MSHSIMVHQITLLDEEGLEKTLVEEGYTQDQIQYTTDFIKDLFDQAAVRIFHDMLAKPLPDSIKIRLLRDKEPVVDVWRQSFEMAGFVTKDHDPRHLVFFVREFVFRSIIDKEDNGYFIVTALHEMLHAADMSVIQSGNAFLDEADNGLQNYRLAYGSNDINPFYAVFDIVSLLLKYRYEGVAVMGSLLLTKRKIEHFSNDPRSFRAQVRSLFWSETLLLMGEGRDEGVIEWLHETAYHEAPGVLLRIMLNNGNLSETCYEKAVAGLEKEDYELTEEELSMIIKRALDIDVKTLLWGLFTLAKDGQTIAPKEPILEFLKLWKENYRGTNEVSLFTNEDSLLGELRDVVKSFFAH